MNKRTTWIIVGLLISYYAFTSGLVYWASRCDVTSSLITPFSWSLSAEERGFMPVSTESDMECVRWLLENRDTNLKIACNANGTSLLQGHIGYPPGAAAKDKPWCEIKYLPEFDECYLFLTAWNTTHSEYIAGSDIGLRSRYPFSIKDIGDGYLLYTNEIYQMSLDDIIEVNKSVIQGHTGYTIMISEVYSCGDSVIYRTEFNE